MPRKKGAAVEAAPKAAKSKAKAKAKAKADPATTPAKARAPKKQKGKGEGEEDEMMPLPVLSPAEQQSYDNQWRQMGFLQPQNEARTSGNFAADMFCYMIHVTSYK